MSQPARPQARRLNLTVLLRLPIVAASARRQEPAGVLRSGAPSGTSPGCRTNERPLPALPLRGELDALPTYCDARWQPPELRHAETSEQVAWAPSSVQPHPNWVHQVC
jgi:hypothetical protein